MRIGEQALKSSNHVAKIERVYYASDGDFVLFECDLDGRKVGILDNAGTASVHLLHELPDTVIDYEIVLLFSDICS